MTVPTDSLQDLTPEFISVFTSRRGEAEAMRAYQAVMDDWSADYQELTVSTSYGLTHVIASGPADGQPVVLLHALFATAASWYRNAGELSKTFRTYAVDVIGEANKSQPTKPIASLEDFLRWFTELIDGLEIDTPYLVGNSYGGFTGAYFRHESARPNSQARPHRPGFDNRFDDTIHAPHVPPEGFVSGPPETARPRAGHASER